MTRAYVMELVGTFFLVLTIGMTVAQGVALAPLAIGLALMVMVYAGGHVSGAHYNPAVTLAAVVRGALPAKELLPYWVAQLLGGVAAAAVARGLAGPFTIAPAPTAGWPAALGVEVLFTFALVLVIFASALTQATKGNSFYGLAIGSTVAAGAWAGGAVSGGAFNPAVGLGAVLVDAVAGGPVTHAWLYVVGPVVGGLLAAWVHRFVSPED